MREIYLFPQILADANRLCEIIVSENISNEKKEKAKLNFVQQMKLLLTDKVLDPSWQSFSESDLQKVIFMGRRLAFIDPYITIDITLKTYWEDLNQEYSLKNEALFELYKSALERLFEKNPLSAIEYTHETYSQKNRRKHSSVKALMLEGYSFVARKLIEENITSMIEFLDQHIIKNVMPAIGITVDLQQTNQMLYAEAMGEYCKNHPFAAVEKTHAFFKAQALSKTNTARALVNIGQNAPADTALSVQKRIRDLFHFTNEPFYETPTLNGAILQSSLDLAMTASSLYPQDAFIAGIETTNHFGTLNRTWETKSREQIEAAANRLFQICADQISLQSPDATDHFLSGLSTPHHPIAQEAVRNLYRKAPKVLRHPKFEI